jgi:hypothetical protein
MESPDPGVDVPWQASSAERGVNQAVYLEGLRFPSATAARDAMGAALEGAARACAGAGVHLARDALAARGLAVAARTASRLLPKDAPR